jgi:hypothetical protein
MPKNITWGDAKGKAQSSYAIPGCIRNLHVIGCLEVLQILLVGVLWRLH